MAKRFEERLYRLKRGDTLSDPGMDGLRFRARSTGTFAELRWKRDGVWRSTPVGRLRPPAQRGPDGVWRSEPGTHSLPDLRRMAGDMSERVAAGLSPKAEAEPSVGFTLGQALALHEKRLRAAKRSERTLENYKDHVERYLSDWKLRPLASLSRSEVRQRHERISKRHGPYSANGCMRTLRALWNTARREDETLPEAPTIAVNWHKEERRDAAIPLAQLPTWYSECMALRSAVRRDYYLLACWTGLRRETLSGIAREHIDLGARTLFIPTPKGGSDKAFTLPLSDFLMQIVERRIAGNAVWWEKANVWRKRKGKAPLTPNAYLFPAHSALGHISEPKANGGDGFTVPFSVHGLRNTFISGCAAAGISSYHTKLLANHAVPKSDVTGGYVSADVETLRPSQEAVSRWLAYATCAWSPLRDGVG